jgi:hypothetical protein
MKKLTKQQRKLYNKYVEQKNNELSVARAISPILIIGLLVGAFYTDGYISIGLVIFAAIIGIASMFNPSSDIENHSR